MSTYALIHGAGDSGWYRHLVDSELRERGHDVVAPDLPCDDDSAGLSEYADAVIDAIGKRGQLVVVAQSFAGFVAPLVCERALVELLVLVAGLIPGAWGDGAGLVGEHGIRARTPGIGVATWRRPSTTTFRRSWRPRR